MKILRSLSLPFYAVSFIFLCSSLAIAATPPPPVQGANVVQLLAEAGRLAAAGKSARALQLLDEAQKLAPRDWQVFNLRGAIHVERKEWSQAIEAFTRAIDSEPTQPSPRYNLGEVYFQQGQYGRARERFEPLFEKDAGNEFLQYKIFLCYLLEGRTQDAQVRLAQFTLEGKTPAYYLAHAAWEIKLGNTDAGWGWIESAQKIYPENQTQFFSESLVRSGLVEGTIMNANDTSGTAGNPASAPLPAAGP